MPMYSYRCANCYTIWDVFHKFSESHDEPCQNCEGSFLNTMAPFRFPQRLVPHKGGTHDSRPIDLEATRQNEKNKEADLAAYKRLRQEGLQPPSTVGAAKLESEAGTKWEVKAGKAVSKKGQKQLQEFLG